MDSAMDLMCDGSSLRAAAKAYGIPPQTLSDRLEQKSQPKKGSNESQQRLSDTAEKRIVDWILKQERLGYAPTASAVKKVVSRLLLLKGDLRPLGKKWVQNFRKRHAELIQTKKGVIQESIRYDSLTPKSVN